MDFNEHDELHIHLRHDGDDEVPTVEGGSPIWREDAQCSSRRPNDENGHGEQEDCRQSAHDVPQPRIRPRRGRRKKG